MRLLGLNFQLLFCCLLLNVKYYYQAPLIERIPDNYCYLCQPTDIIKISVGFTLTDNNKTITLGREILVMLLVLRKEEN